MIAALLLALSFHLIPVPTDLDITAEFALQGYLVPATCSPDDDEADKCDRTAIDTPGFLPETDTLRAVARVWFIAPLTGTCAIAQTDTVKGKTNFIPIATVDVQKGKPVSSFAVLYDGDDDAVAGFDVKDHYRIVAGCSAKNGKTIFSSFYEVRPSSATSQT